ncbi:SDR family NAD(P)-dependent oxidoreductase, partial [Mycolicibacterium porcinum]|uniref:SDR family NAD(P)-dependent oxidoreductase n=1 Tax=Mycolicibacterium porcinum TaxID=39693 RepID=UPI000A8A605A
MSYSHPHSLDGHAVIVTGAARGVGKGIATALLSRGARVLVTDILDDVLANTTAEFTDAGFDVASVVADLRDADSAQRIVDAALGAFGTANGLVNNAVARGSIRQSEQHTPGGIYSTAAFRPLGDGSAGSVVGGRARL